MNLMPEAELMFPGKTELKVLTAVGCVVGCNVAAQTAGLA